MAAGDPNAAPADPMADAGDPNAVTPEDPNAAADPMAADDPNAMPEEPMSGEEGGDSTMDIINQLSPDDREAVRAYAESMLARDETKLGGEETAAPGSEAPVPAAPEAQAPMMEIRKGDLKRVQKRLSEEMFWEPGEKKNSDRVQKKVNGGKNNFNNPFSSPIG